MLGRPLNQPDGRFPGQVSDALYGEADMLPFLRLVHVVVVDPAPPVAEHLVPMLNEGAGQIRIMLAGRVRPRGY